MITYFVRIMDKKIQPSCDIESACLQPLRHGQHYSRRLVRDLFFVAGSGFKSYEIFIKSLVCLQNTFLRLM